MALPPLWGSRRERGELARGGDIWEPFASLRRDIERLFEDFSRDLGWGPMGNQYRAQYGLSDGRFENVYGCKEHVHNTSFARDCSLLLIAEHLGREVVRIVFFEQSLAFMGLILFLLRVSLAGRQSAAFLRQLQFGDSARCLGLAFAFRAHGGVKDPGRPHHMRRGRTA